MLIDNFKRFAEKLDKLDFYDRFYKQFFLDLPPCFFY